MLCLGARERKNQLGNIGGFHPFREIDLGHGFAITRCVHRAWKDDVSGDTRIGVFERYGLHKHSKRGLRGNIGAKIRAGLHRGKATNGNEPAGTRLAQVGNGFPKNAERRCQIQIQHLLPNFVRRLGHRSATRKTAEHVYQNIQPPVVLYDFRDAPANLVKLGEVRRQRLEIRPRKIRSCNLPGRANHARALLEESAGDRCAEASIRSGDEDDFIFHENHSFSERSFVRESSVGIEGFKTKEEIYTELDEASSVGRCVVWKVGVGWHGFPER